MTGAVWSTQHCCKWIQPLASGCKAADQSSIRLYASEHASLKKSRCIDADVTQTCGFTLRVSRYLPFIQVCIISCFGLAAQVRILPLALELLQMQVCRAQHCLDTGNLQTTLHYAVLMQLLFPRTLCSRLATLTWQVWWKAKVSMRRDVTIR